MSAVGTGVDTKEYDRARDMAITDAARQQTSGCLRGKSMDEVRAYINKQTQYYLRPTGSSSGTKKKETYVQSDELYWKHYESNNRY